MSRADHDRSAPVLPRPAVVRLKLRLFALFTVVAVVAGLPVWSWLALLAVTALIPVAVVTYGGPGLLREVLWPRRPAGRIRAAAGRRRRVAADRRTARRRAGPAHRTARRRASAGGPTGQVEAAARDQ